jgi:hypothetical protein
MVSSEDKIWIMETCLFGGSEVRATRGANEGSEKTSSSEEDRAG